MKDSTRTKLIEMIKEYGQEICEEPQRLKGLLLDLCGNQRREINTLILAISEGHLERLKASRHAAPQIAILNSVLRLQEDVGLTEEAARWAMESWGVALGIINAPSAPDVSGLMAPGVREKANSASPATISSIIKVCDTDISESYRKYPLPRGTRLQCSVKKVLPGQTVGIDLGATYSAIAMLSRKDGNPVLLPNADGRNITPSVVILDEGEIIVGPSFEQICVSNPDSIIQAIKREMGNSGFNVIYEGRTLTPSGIASLIIAKMKLDAEKTIGPIVNAVVTVPYYFNARRRMETRDACAMAGLNVIDVINDCSASALAYSWQMAGNFSGHRKNDANATTSPESCEKNILVFDLGGGSFNAALAKCTPNGVVMLAADGDVMLGGLDWTETLCRHLIEQFKQKFGVDPSEDPETMLVFHQEAEDAKRDLSSKAEIPLSVFYQGDTLSLWLTRTEFERMTIDLLRRTEDTTEFVIQQSGVTPAALDDVVLIGGSTYMPVVELMLRECFGRKPSRSLAPEAAVAQGAAIYGAMIQARATPDSNCFSSETRERLLHFDLREVLLHSFGIAVMDPNDSSRIVNHLVLSKNTALPCRCCTRLELTVSTSAQIRLSIFRGDAIDVDNCERVCDVLLEAGLLSFAKGSKIDVILSCATEDEFEIQVFDAASGTELELVKEWRIQQ
jgi:molecular chaperone DnaK